jgi:hypothetical protein
MAPMFPNPRRIVTGHDSEGNAVFVDDKPIPTVPTPFDCDFAVLYETHEFPAGLDEWKDPILEPTKSLANEDGVVLRVVDFKPNVKTVCLFFVSSGVDMGMESTDGLMMQRFHRTMSLDFGILFEGEITW